MRFNVKLLAATVATMILLVAGVVYLHAYQVRRTAGSLKEHAAREWADGRLDKAADYQRRYVALVPSDIDALADYADLRDKLARSGREHYSVLEIYEKILRQEPDRQEIRRLAIKKAMLLHLWTATADHINWLAGSAEKEALDGELLYWAGLCRKAIGQEKGSDKGLFKEAAEDLFKSAYKNGENGRPPLTNPPPTWLLDSYLQRALVLRAQVDQDASPSLDKEAKETQAKKIKEIDDTLALMVANHKEAPAAYLALLAYLKLPAVDANLPTGQDADAVRKAKEAAAVKAWKERKADAVANALKCGGEDAGVLLAAADWAREAGEDPVADTKKRQEMLEEQRKHLEKGAQNYPQDLRFCDALSRLEWQAGYKDKAEKILRDFLNHQLPEADAAQARYLLAELLIESGKLDEAETESSQLAGTPLAKLVIGHIRCVQERWQESAQVLEDNRVKLAAVPNLVRKADLLLATCYEHMDEPDLQLAASQRAVSMDPSLAGGRIALASALAANGKLAEALAEFRRLAKQSNLPKDLQFELDFNIARLLASQLLRLPKSEQQSPRSKATRDEINQRLKNLTESEDALPKSPRVHLLRAEWLLAQGDAQKAREALEGPLEKNPKQLELLIGLAELEEQQGNRQKALEKLTDAEKQVGDNVQLQLALVRYWADQRVPDKERAFTPDAEAALFGLAAKIDEKIKPDQEEANRDLERRRDPHITAKESDELDRRADERARKTKEPARVTALLAEELARAGRKEDAKRLWTTVAGLQWKDMRARLALVEFAVGDRDGKEAMRLVEEEIKRIEGDNGTWWRFEKAAVLLFLGPDQDAAEADSLLREAAERRPAWARIPRLQGQLADKRDHDRAIEYFQRAVDLGERDPQTIGVLLRRLYERQRFSDADMVLRKAAENNAVLSADLNKLGTQIAVFNRDRDLARKLAIQAVPDNDPDYHNHLWLAFVLAGLDDSKAPETALEKAKLLKPDAPEVWVAAVAFHRNARLRARDQNSVERTTTALRKALKDAEENLTKTPLALAECYDLVGRAEDAERLFDKLYKESLKAPTPDVATLRGVAAHYQPQRRQPQRAEDMLRRMLDPALKVSDVDASWARRALALVIAPRGDASKVQEALTLLENADAPDDMRARSWILATQTTRLQEAIDLYEKFEKTTPLTSDDLFTLAGLYDAAKKWPEARDRMNALIATEPDNLEYLFAFANGMIQHDELEDARGIVIKIKSLQPKALSPLEQAKALSALELDVRLHEAKAKRGEPKELDEAAKLIQGRAQEKDAPLEGLAALMESIGKTEEAEVLYMRLAKDAKKPEDVLKLALFFGRTDRPVEGLRICEQARQTCKREEDVALATVAIARSKAATNELRESVERWLQPIVEQTPSSEMLSIWAELQDLRGQYAKAEQAWRAVLDKDQNNVIALNNLACQLAFTHTKTEEALQLINRAIARVGPMNELLDTRGLVYLAAGRSDLAIADLELAAHRGPGPAKYYHLARTYQLAAMPDAARDAWRKAEKANLKPDHLHPLEVAEYNEFVAKMSGK